MNCPLCLEAFEAENALQSHLGEKHVRGDMSLKNLNSTIYGAEVNVLITSTDHRSLEGILWVVNAIYHYEAYLREQAGQ